ncbi:MAG: hypothetical protein ACREFF_07440 [Candidatus Udaeobacter sp.]
MVFALDTLPAGCEPATLGLEDLQLQAILPPSELVAYFLEHPDVGERLLSQSYDKRYTASTFIEEIDGGYQVGWFDHDRMHVHRFSELSEAAADYLLLSFGRGRLRCPTI